MKKLRTWILYGLTTCLVAILLSCQPAAQTPPVSSPPPAATPTSPPPAKITEILQQPVTVRQPPATADVPAQTGMGLRVGDTIRTQGEAMAEVTLSNGLGFRVGRNSLLTIQPDNRLNLSAGDMITWVQPGKKVPAEIITPTVVTGIRGTTVFVNVPKTPGGETTVFSWEGSVSVRFPGQTEELILKTGEEVGIRPGDRTIAALRRRIRRFTPQEYDRRRREAVLLRRFKRRLPTLDIIDRAKPGTGKNSQVQRRSAQPAVQQRVQTVIKARAKRQATENDQDDDSEDD